MSDAELRLARDLTEIVIAVQGVTAVFTPATPAVALSALASAVVPGIDAAPRPEVMVVVDDATTTVSVSLGIDESEPGPLVARTVHAAIEQHLRDLGLAAGATVEVRIARIG